MVQVSVHINPFLPATPHLPTRRKLTWKISEADSSSSSASSSCGYSYDKQRTDGQLVFPKKKRSRVFFLDVNPLCYAGSKPSLHSFANWVSLFFNHVSLSDPVIAVSSHKDHWASWFEFLFSVVYVLYCGRLLMVKEEASTAGSCCLRIKHTGGNCQDSFQKVMLEGHMDSSLMFSQNAMCLWVTLLVLCLNMIQG